MARVEELYAFIFEPKDPGQEDIVAVKTGQGLIPLVGAGIEKMEALRPLALQVAQNSGVRIKVLRFSNREELETLGE
jgi:hypothetical protein